jgi:hypothetical protein
MIRWRARGIRAKDLRHRPDKSRGKMGNFMAGLDCIRHVTEAYNPVYAPLRRIHRRVRAATVPQVVDTTSSHIAEEKDDEFGIHEASVHHGTSAPIANA